MKIRLLAMVVALASLSACGASSSSSETASGSSGTSGGEGEPERAHPIRTTTPIPVPTPAIARDELSPELQQVWELVEAAIAVRPPEPPAEATHDAVEAWAQGPLTAWLTARVEATAAAEEALLPLEGAPAWERGIAGGLIGYLHEDTAADVRGAPIADDIASDAELLRVYEASLTRMLAPFAGRAVEAYRFCGAAFDEVSDSLWEEWASYCDDRGDEVIEVFRLGAGGEPAEAEPAAQESTEPAPQPSTSG